MILESSNETSILSVQMSVPHMVAKIVITKISVGLWLQLQHPTWWTVLERFLPILTRELGSFCITVGSRSIGKT